MNRPLEALLVLLLLIICAGFTLGLTYAPCFASLCSEEFFPVPTRYHVAGYFSLLASVGCVLLLRAYSPTCLYVSNYYLTKRRVPILDKRISVGGLALSLWLVGITVASTGFWIDPESSFWELRTRPLHWVDAKIRLTVTGVLGHHADIFLGLVLIPVSRNSVLGRVFELHQSTLLFAHKLIAYGLFVVVLAHGAATYTFVATYGAAADPSPRKNAFNIDNPTLTGKQTEIRGGYYSATLGTGMIAFMLMVVIIVTALPALRRRSYNTFYYAHVICSTLIFISASIHASTDFYFLLPGLLLWVFDWAWRLFRGDTGVRRKVRGKLEDAGYGWYRISLPVSEKVLLRDASEVNTMEGGKQTNHPLQSYYVNIPSISKLQNHAFTAARIGSSTSGPVFLFQRTQGHTKMKQKKLDKEWTWKAGVLASDAGGDEERPQVSNNVEIRVEGPYIPTEVDYQVADHIVCVVGGTGLTGAYSLALWWLDHRIQDSNAHFTLIWTIRQRDTSQLQEWRDLEDRVDRAGENIQLKVHVSSENGRIDPMKSIRETFARSDEKSSASGQKAWVYVSGPAGLLDSAEDACVDLERELRKARKLKNESGLTISQMHHYIAKWEV